MNLRLFILGFMGLMGCDSDGRYQCAWTLEADADRKDQRIIYPSIPVCVRNRLTMKQNCRLQCPLDLAKRMVQKTFRYADMKLDTSKNPPLITSIDTCKGSP